MDKFMQKVEDSKVVEVCLEKWVRVIEKFDGQAYYNWYREVELKPLPREIEVTRYFNIFRNLFTDSIWVSQPFSDSEGAIADADDLCGSKSSSSMKLIGIAVPMTTKFTEGYGVTF